MTKKKLNEDLLEQEESSATVEDLLISGDEFHMNLVEKSDVDYLEDAADPKYQKEGVFGSLKAEEDHEFQIKEVEVEASTAGEDDLVEDGDQFEMNLVEKTDTGMEEQPVHPDYQSELKRK
ncbi:MAG: hypothetical protein GX778_04355 [Erysipelothrix sp.]|nr:hypothetical protein [Erysipelothrix sp.]